MRYSKKVTFLPWIGRKYNIQDLKVLILGESMYIDGIEDPPNPDATKWRIEKSINENWAPFFTKIYKLLCEENEISPFNGFTVPDFWESVSFYNYIQEYMERARIRPSIDQWQNSTEAFTEVIQKISPDIIFCFGKELYRNLPELKGESIKTIKIQHNKKPIISDTWQYSLNTKQCLVVELMHPSAPGFTYKPWKKIIQKTLSRILPS